jgi:hypothetical protein
MTRRGSLAYYLAAVVCGCFFMAVMIALRFVAADRAVGMQGKSFFFLAFTSLIFGALPALLAAFLLRQLMRKRPRAGPWEWAVLGAVLAWMVIFLLGKWGLALGERPGRSGLASLLELALRGPTFVLGQGSWLALPAGAATAFLLYKIDRAFAPAPDSGATRSPHP